MRPIVTGGLKISLNLSIFISFLGGGWLPAAAAEASSSPQEAVTLGLTSSLAEDFSPEPEPGLNRKFFAEEWQRLSLSGEVASAPLAEASPLSWTPLTLPVSDSLSPLPYSQLAAPSDRADSSMASQTPSAGSALTQTTTQEAIAQAIPQETDSQQTIPPQAPPSTDPEPLDIDPEVIQNSPVLQRWLQQVPNVQSDIRNDPSFRTRLRLGYSNFLSGEDASGLNVGIEDVFIGSTGLTVSADYQTAFEQNWEAYGTELRYYILPLGSPINVAPVAGYRHVESDRDSISGVNLGLRLMLALSRTGAADISLSQSFVAPGTENEIGITTFSFGYALTRQIRLSTDLQKQNSPQQKENRVGISLEWLL